MSHRWTKTTATRRPASRTRQARFRPAGGRLEALEARCLLSGFGDDFDEAMEELRDTPIDVAATPGPTGPQSGPVGQGSGPGANVNTDTVDAYSNETTIAVNPGDPRNLVVGANDGQLVVDAQGNVHETLLTRAHVTFDGGRSWTDYAIPNPSGYSATGDPSVAFDADGRAYLATLGFDLSDPNSVPDVVVSTSADEGRSWSTPATVAAGSLSSAGVVFNDKESVAAWGHGNAVVTWDAILYDGGFNFVAQPGFASVTHDGGKTWSEPVQVTGALAFDLVPVVAADGSVYVSFTTGDYEQGPDYRDSAAVVKLDPATGQPLGAPVVVGTMYDGLSDLPYNVDGRPTLQDSQFRVAPILNMAADPTDAGHLAVVWADPRNNPYTEARVPSSDPYAVTTNDDVIVSQSFDGGRTWSTPAAIARPNDQFFPWAAYDETGRLQIGFNDRSYDPANHAYGYTIASEVHRGRLDFAFQQASTALSDPTRGNRWYRVTANPAYPDASRMIGDYTGIAAVPGRRVAAVWTDLREQATFMGRTGAGQDAYFAIVKTVPSAFDAGLSSAADATWIAVPDSAVVAGPVSLLDIQARRRRSGS